MNPLVHKLHQASHYFEYKEHDAEMISFLGKFNFAPANQTIPEKNQNVLFVTPQFFGGSGGLTSILRIATACAKNGYHVYIYDYSGIDVAKDQEAALKNLKDFQGQFITDDDVKSMKFEFIVATNWQSVYVAKDIPGYKLYFVQDYEPYFYKASEEYFLAKDTYGMGLHVVSLGKWNLQEINKHGTYDGKQSYIDFPYEPKEYPFQEKDYSAYLSKKQIKFAVYVKRGGKRLISLIKALFYYANKQMKEELGIELYPYFYGLGRYEKVPCGENACRLSKKELCDLYHECDFGMCASMTNVSLVPLEMLGAGLPIFEFEDGSYTAFLGEKTATMLGYDYREFVSKLTLMLKNPPIIKAQIGESRKELATLTWDKTCEQFIGILKGVETDL